MALSKQKNVRLVCFDLDGTLVERTVFIWSTLHERFGSDPHRRKQAADAHSRGRISYAEWFRIDLELLKERGAHREAMLEVFADLAPAPGATEALRTLKERGYRLGLISGSLDLVLEHFFPQAPFDHVLINQVYFDKAGRIVGGTPTPYDLEGKADGLSELARREGLSIRQCAYVGDHTNDLAVMRAAGFSVGVHLKSPEVAAAVDVAIHDPDLRSLLVHFPAVGGKDGR